MSDPRNFIFDSDYPPDYIVKALTKSYTLVGDPMGYGTVNLDTIPHGLPFAPLVDGIWGITSDLSDARSIAYDHGPNFIFGMVILQIYVTSDETNIYIYCVNSEYPPITRTFYFKLWMYMNPAYSGSVAPVEDNTNYRFNTDFNYLKLAMAGNVSIPAGQSITVNHGLGFIPRALAWSRVDLGVGATNTFQIQKASIDESKLTITNPALSTRTASYRIYAND